MKKNFTPHEGYQNSNRSLQATREIVQPLDIRKASAQSEPVTKHCYEAGCFRVTNLR
jgi:hypothetical protein